MVQYMYSINEVCGNDQPKKDTFFRLKVYVDIGKLPFRYETGLPMCLKELYLMVDALTRLVL